jgi:hypothetical protein
LLLSWNSAAQAPQCEWPHTVMSRTPSTVTAYSMPGAGGRAMLAAVARRDHVADVPDDEELAGIGAGHRAGNDPRIRAGDEQRGRILPIAHEVQVFLSFLPEIAAAEKGGAGIRVSDNWLSLLYRDGAAASLRAMN